jgi:hypothetical protein
MLPSFATQTITVIRPKLKDERGSLVPDWNDTEVPFDIEGCSVQPASTSLSLDGRVLGMSDGWTAYLPEDSDVKAGDHIVWDGNTYEINGEPRKWTGPMRTSNIQLNLIRWEG